MARPKRSSLTLQKAEKREAGLQAINPTLDLGHGLTLEKYSALIQTLRSQIAGYNLALANLDACSRQIKDTEKQLRDLSEQMLLGVAAKYGKNSGEYGKAGGVLKGEYRRSTQRKPIESKKDVLPTMVLTTQTQGQASSSVNGNGNGKVLVS